MIKFKWQIDSWVGTVRHREYELRIVGLAHESPTLEPDGTAPMAKRT